MEKIMRRNLCGALLLVALMFCIPLISGAPPQSTENLIVRGVDIVHPETPVVKYNEDLEFNFWTYNSSNGATLTNTSLNCTLYIVDNTGNQYYRFSNQAGANGLITYGKGAPLCINCWTMTLPKENISLGVYSYQTKCQGLQIGGYSTGFFEVTLNGNPPPEGITIVIFTLIFIAIFGFGLISFLKALGNVLELNMDIIDTATMMATYFSMWIFYLFSMEYLGNPFVNEILEIAISIGGFTHVFLPIVGFLVSFIMSTLKFKQKARITY